MLHSGLLVFFGIPLKWDGMQLFRGAGRLCVG